MSSSRRAIITGAANGIGSAIAVELAEHGWHVILADVDASGAIELAERINSKQGISTKNVGNEDSSGERIAASVELDVRSEQSVQSFFANLASTDAPAVSALVNNAGVQTWSPLLDLSLQDWNNTLSVNLTGCFLMTREFARYLGGLSPSHELSGGDIINIGSGCNRLAFPKLVDYTASKGGIEMFTKSAALELGKAGICVNCLAPGAIETSRTATETGDYAASWAALTPLQRVGQVNDVAMAARMLLEQPTGFITGQTIAVDGGLFSAAAWPREY